MRFEDRRTWGADNRIVEAELFYRDLMGGGMVRARAPRGRMRRPLFEEAADEAAVGQARIADRQYLIDPTGAVIARGTALDDVLLQTLGQRTGQSVVLGNAVGGTSFTSQAWNAGTAPATTPRTIEFDAAGVAALIVDGGNRVYLQAHPTSTAADKLDWVHVPSVEEFLRLPLSQRTSQRTQWVNAIRRARATNPGTRSPWTVAEFEALASPVLRLLLADNVAAALPVTDHAAGGVVNGVTLPMLRYPITEPQVYLRVISNVEGRMESINAWDAGAGISLGPIQINVQRGALFRFLWSVWQADRVLFARALGNEWTMREVSGQPELSVRVAGAEVWLRATSAAEEQRAVGYFQSGNPARAGLRDADLDHRRRLAARFATLIGWPHVQELLEDASAAWLQPGLDQIHAAGIPALDPNRPDRDLFILKALLLSTFVRFSGCLGPLLTALAGWRSVSDKLAHWKDALAAMGGACSASGTTPQRERNAILLPRLERQVRDAQGIFTALEAILAARNGGTRATPASAARSGAEFFDHVVAGRVWQVDSARQPLAMLRGGFAENRLPTAQPQVLATRCGFSGLTAMRTEQELRQAIRDAALAEWTRWHTSTGAPRLENDIAMFGNLVRYYLSAVGALAPAVLTAVRTAANGAIAYAPIPASGATDAAIRTWADRVAQLLLAGATGVTATPALQTLIARAVSQARHAHLDSGAFSAWSAVWVTSCVRGVGIQLGFEGTAPGGHIGRDKLLVASTRHSEYTLEAHRRRVGASRTDGTYHAFPPADRVPEIGDIIVQDRHAQAPAVPLSYADIESLSGGRALHGDIVIERAADHVVAIGGNLGGSCRRRRYPTRGDRLVVAQAQLYTQEDGSGVLPALPATTTERLHTRSTLRIVSLLSPVQECAALPGQPYGGGILT